MKYKIYKLVYDNTVVYVGRTKTTLKLRKQNGYGRNQQFFKLCDIELIEETDDISRERYWIEYYRNSGEPLFNIKKGDGLDYQLYSKTYYKENKAIINKKAKISQQGEKRKEYRKNYILLERVKQKKSEYYFKNKERLSKKAKLYYQENKEILIEKSREYYEKNKLNGIKL